MPALSLRLRQGLGRAQARMGKLGSTRPLQLSALAGAVLVAWGLWVWFPFVAFVGPNFEAFLSWRPELWWGRAVFTVGILQLAAAFFDNGRLWRSAANGLSFFTFGTIAGTFALSSPGSTGVLIYSVFALVALLAFIARLIQGEHD